MKTMHPPGYHHKHFEATNALGRMMKRTSFTLVHELPQS